MSRERTFMDEAIFESLTATRECPASTQESDPLLSFLSAQESALTNSFAQYAEIISAYKERAELCGCKSCWREYYKIFDYYTACLSVPETEECFDQDELTAVLDQFTPGCEK